MEFPIRTTKEAIVGMPAVESYFLKDIILFAYGPDGGQITAHVFDRALEVVDIRPDGRSYREIKL